MKKFKKFFAVLLALAMVLGMSMTSFAASTDKGTITIKGLAQGETTTLTKYQFISWNTTSNNWEVAGWAQPYVTEADGKYTVTNAAGLEGAVQGEGETIEVTGTTYEYTNVAIGAYLILASGNKTTYTPMIADVAAYGTDGLITAKAVTITAKTSGYTLDKSANDNFVARGETVTFTITTTFPSFPNADSQDNAYTIVDTPTGLGSLTLTGVKIGGINVNGKSMTANDDGSYTLDLTSEIGTENANAGKTVEVTYTAVVTADDGYQNTANAFRGNENLGGGDENGFTGSITVKKVDSADQTQTLAGAEFNVLNEDEETLWFVNVSEGVYKLAAQTEEGASQTVVATNGTVKVKGLGEGTYKFVETKAPEGYSVANDVLDPVEITEGDDDVNITDLNYVNTKLSSLPSTGGIGTTIFTIGGCLIMIIAAGLFFASRRKSAK